jgi:predicted dehydrogenase
MTEPRLRLGVVGCGRLVERGYLPAIAAMSDFELVAVADPSPERCAALAPSVPGFVSADDLLAEAAPDALVIASPVGSHVSDAHAASRAGVVALVEKPPAVDAAEAAQLLALSPAPFVGFNRRFDPGARAARAAVPADGALELDLALQYRRAAWGAHTVRDDALLDLGPHLIDWARWISGRPVRSVACATLAPERVELVLELEGAVARLRAATDRPHEERISVRHNGSHIAQHRTGGLVAGVRGRLRRGGGPDALVATLRAELAAYATALRTQEPTELGTPADGRAVMAIIDAARTSASRAGATIPLPIEVAP